jgi:hypothetical protein
MNPKAEPFVRRAKALSIFGIWDSDFILLADLRFACPQRVMMKPQHLPHLVE